MRLSDVAAAAASAETREAVERLARRVETVEELLLLSLEEVRAAAALRDIATAAAIVAQVAQTLLTPLPANALPPRRAVLTGNPLLDEALRPAPFALGSVVEIAGESAAGKTQLALQLCAQVQAPPQHGGLDGSAVYVAAEGPFPQRRFEELCEALRPRFPDARTDLLSRLWVLPAVQLRPPQLPALFAHLEERCCNSSSSSMDGDVDGNTPPVRLLVIDSVAALYRTEFARDEALERAQGLWALGHTLHRIAARGVCVVVVNQVTDEMAPPTQQQQQQQRVAEEQMTRADAAAGSELSALLRSREVRPALGLGWSNCINTRLLLSRTSLQLKSAEVSGVVRKLQVVLSPCMPQTTVFFGIAADGLHGIPDADLVS